MPESRDRRQTHLDIADVLADVFARRRLHGVRRDDELHRIIFGSPPPATVVRTGFGTPRNGAGRGRGLIGSGSENRSPWGSGGRRGGRGRGGSLLPSWYPRTPLRDITTISRAIERRRARLRENEGQQSGTTFPADQLLPDPSESHPREQGSSLVTPKPSLSVKLRTPGGKVPMILLDIANQKTEGDSELTPQKKLLNSIDDVEKVVKEELQRLKRTPSAKKAEREKRVRTLMSMR